MKPVNEGSSVGVIIVREDRTHPPQELLRDDWPYGDQVLVEKYIPGRELTCAVMGDKALGVIDIRPATGMFYDYDAKYVERWAPFTSSRQKLNRIFTNRFKSWR